MLNDNRSGTCAAERRVAIDEQLAIQFNHNHTTSPALGVNNLYVQAGQNILFRRTTSATEVGGFSNGNAFFVQDGVSAPGAVSGRAYLFVDSADGDLKVRFGDGVTKTLATDT